MNFAEFDQRPIIVAIAGPNGAGKTTFYHAHLASSGLTFVNADLLSSELGIGPYEAARLANALRHALFASGESFVFETVFSDPVGDKVAFLEDAARSGYAVVLCYIGLADRDQSAQRVQMRVAQGGHGVPTEKLLHRFRRTIDNLQAAVANLPHVMVYDNSNLGMPFRELAVFESGSLVRVQEPIPDWFRQVTDLTADS